MASLAQEIVALGSAVLGENNGELFTGTAALMHGNVELFRHATDTIEARGRDREIRVASINALLFRGIYSLITGDLTGAEAHASEIAQHSPDPGNLAAQAVLMMYIRRDQGRIAEMLPTIRGFIEVLPQYDFLRALLTPASVDTDDVDGV